MAKFVLVKDELSNDVVLNIDNLIEIEIFECKYTGIAGITTSIDCEIRSFHIESPEIIAKIKNYINENML